MEDATDLPSVCVVTHPLSSSGENATRSLLTILSAITSVRLITADLPLDSDIRNRFDVVEITRRGVGTTIHSQLARFVLNQLSMCREIVRSDEEVVLFFGATSYLLPILCAKARGKTVAVEPRGDVPLTLRLSWETRIPTPLASLFAGGVRLLERLGFHLADAIITYTPEMAEQLGLNAADSKVYSSGARFVDVELFTPTVPLSERGMVVGYIGRLDEEKGIRTLAAVARALPSDITFRFVGDGDLRRWLERELATEIDRGTVEIGGWVGHDDVPSELNRMRLLVMTSQPTEGLPTTILEAFACGTPVYATPVAGVPDVIRPGETGFFLEQEDPTAIASRITDMLFDEDLDRLSDNARLLCERDFTFEAAVERYREIVESLR